MSRSIGDINAKLAYITNRSTGPILKTKRPLLINKPRFPKIELQSSMYSKISLKTNRSDLILILNAALNALQLSY